MMFLVGHSGANHKSESFLVQKQVVLSTFCLQLAVALPYGMGSAGSINGGASLGGLGLLSGGGGGVVPAAVISQHQVSTFDVPTTGMVKQTTIDVPANVLPISFVFRSASSAINVEAKHEGAQGSFKQSESEDEPHKLLHVVVKPIIQEVREIISPYRKITQTVKPVYEEVQTLIARGRDASGGTSDFGAAIRQEMGSKYESGPKHESAPEPLMPSYSEKSTSSGVTYKQTMPKLY